MYQQTQNQFRPPANDFNPTGERYVASTMEWPRNPEQQIPYRWGVWRWDPPSGYTCVVLMDRYPGEPEAAAKMLAWMMNRRSDGEPVMYGSDAYDISGMYEGPWIRDPWIRDDGTRITQPAL